MEMTFYETPRTSSETELRGFLVGNLIPIPWQMERKANFMFEIALAVNEHLMVWTV